MRKDLKVGSGFFWNYSFPLHVFLVQAKKYARDLIEINRVSK